MERIVVVSNRVVVAKEKSVAGGLAVAVGAALKEAGGIWFGWSGTVTETSPSAAHTVRAGKINYVTLDLSTDDYGDYYSGYANRTLWPLFHYRVDLAAFDRRFYDGYHRVNDLFADRLIELLQPNDLVWVHDYHLIPLGEALRRAGYDGPIGFFLHIPFPAPQVLTALFNHRRLVRSLMSYDLIGFQTHSDLRAFHDYILHEARGAVDASGLVHAYDQTARASAFPIGIDTKTFTALATSAEAARQGERLKRSLGGGVAIIGVDRLDYTKGLIERFHAFEHLLESYPDNRGKVVLTQIAPPSRSDVPEYADLRQHLEAAAGHVNGRFSDFDWTPIRYVNKAHSHRALAGLLRLSRVGLVTPLRDGMNIVAKEFIAAQDPEDPGVLVLSRFAGAAEQLEEAVIVNPHDTEDVAKRLDRALKMRREERIERWRALYDRVASADVHAWRRDYVAALKDAHRKGVVRPAVKQGRRGR